MWSFGKWNGVLHLMPSYLIRLSEDLIRETHSSDFQFQCQFQLFFSISYISFAWITMEMQKDSPRFEFHISVHVVNWYCQFATHACVFVEKKNDVFIFSIGHNRSNFKALNIHRQIHLFCFENADLKSEFCRFFRMDFNGFSILFTERSLKHYWFDLIRWVFSFIF